jgi:hypothetical protein
MRPRRFIFTLLIICVLSWLGWCSRDEFAPTPAPETPTKQKGPWRRWWEGVRKETAAAIAGEPADEFADDGGPYGSPPPIDVEVEGFGAPAPEETLTYRQGWE